MRAGLVAAAFGGLLIAGAQQAHAIPALQVYADGGTYDNSNSEESWVLNVTAGSPFKIWAVGDGSKPTTNVSLIVSWTGAFNPSNLTIEGTTTGSALFTDPSDAGGVLIPSAVHVGGSGGDNPQDLPAHGIFNQNVPVFWQEFSLGNFNLDDSPIADFNDGFTGLPHANKTGQINAYEVTVNQTVALHFDLYGFDSKGKFVKAPFSHDALVGTTRVPPAPVVPEPGTLSLLALGSIGLGGFGWRRRKTAA